MKTNLILLLFIFFIIDIWSDAVKVAAVQLEVNNYTYSSYKQFQVEMENNIAEAMETFKPDLIIFPEYTSVFPAITPYYQYLDDKKSIAEIFLDINSDNRNIRSLYDIFRSESVNVDNMLSFWGDLSRKYSVTIIGGSYFSYSDDNLTNRLIVFGPSGERIYEQDKYFLTEFETDILSLSSGSPLKPSGFYIKDKHIVTTICRDTFLDRWESMYADADLWIDIKANGEYFREEQKSLFARALPARMKDSAVNYGVTVCLTGQFLELFWEGESSLVKKIGNDVHTFIKSTSYRSNEIIYFVVE